MGDGSKGEERERKHTCRANTLSNSSHGLSHTLAETADQTADEVSWGCSG